VILIVDDDPRIRSATASALRTAGHDVLDFASGPAALAELERGATPHLLISDVLMPEMNGPALAKAVRAHLPKLPILFISGDIGATDPAIFADDPLLAKPFTATALYDAVAQCLAKHR
jgi:two-component system, cell cycle sensor histidine kinase and response regulator CckA